MCPTGIDNKPTRPAPLPVRELKTGLYRCFAAMQVIYSSFKAINAGLAVDFLDQFNITRGFKRRARLITNTDLTF